MGEENKSKHTAEASARGKIIEGGEHFGGRNKRKKTNKQINKRLLETCAMAEPQNE